MNDSNYCARKRPVNTKSTLFYDSLISPLGLRSRAVRRRHGVRGGAPVNFGRRRRRAAGPKNSAEARRWRPKQLFSKIPENSPFYPQHFLMTFFSNRKL